MTSSNNGHKPKTELSELTLSTDDGHNGELIILIPGELLRQYGEPMELQRRLQRRLDALSDAERRDLIPQVKRALGA